MERGLPTTPVFNRDQLWHIAASATIAAPSEEAMARVLRDAHVELHVSTKLGIKQRRRAGLVFTQQPTTITVSAATADVLRADDGLEVHETRTAAAGSAAEREAFLARQSEEELKAAAERLRAREKARASRAKDPGHVASARAQDAELGAEPKSAPPPRTAKTKGGGQ
jgi:hypothetical protein